VRADRWEDGAGVSERTQCVSGGGAAHRTAAVLLLAIQFSWLAEVRR